MAARTKKEGRGWGWECHRVQLCETAKKTCPALPKWGTRTGSLICGLTWKLCLLVGICIQMQNQVFSNYFTYSNNMQNTFLKVNLLLQAEKEAREAEKCKQELGLGDGEDDLKALIQVRLLASVEDTCGTGLYLCFP